MIAHDWVSTPHCSDGRYRRYACQRCFCHFFADDQLLEIAQDHVAVILTGFCIDLDCDVQVVKRIMSI